MFEGLLAISDTFRNKLNVLALCWLHILQNFTAILYDFEKKWLSSFA